MNRFILYKMFEEIEAMASMASFINQEEHIVLEMIHDMREMGEMESFEKMVALVHDVQPVHLLTRSINVRSYNGQGTTRIVPSSYDLFLLTRKYDAIMHRVIDLRNYFLAKYWHDDFSALAQQFFEAIDSHLEYAEDTIYRMKRDLADKKACVREIRRAAHSRIRLRSCKAKMRILSEQLCRDLATRIICFVY
jgi:hypothetical protein